MLASLHLAKVLGNVELGARVLLDVLDSDIGCQLRERQLALLPVHFEHALVKKLAHRQSSHWGRVASLPSQ